MTLCFVPSVEQDKFNQKHNHLPALPKDRTSLVDKVTSAEVLVQYPPKQSEMKEKP